MRILGTVRALAIVAALTASHTVSAQEQEDTNKAAARRLASEAGEHFDRGEFEQAGVSAWADDLEEAEAVDGRPLERLVEPGIDQPGDGVAHVLAADGRKIDSDRAADSVAADGRRADRPAAPRRSGDAAG